MCLAIDEKRNVIQTHTHTHTHAHIGVLLSHKKETVIQVTHNFH